MGRIRGTRRKGGDDHSGLSAAVIVRRAELAEAIDDLNDIAIIAVAGLTSPEIIGERLAVTRKMLMDLTAPRIGNR